MRLDLRRACAWLCAWALLLCPIPANALLWQSPPASFQELSEAAQLVSAGDYERAVRLLETLAPRLAGDPATRPRAVQAYVLLATSQVALGRNADAKASFIAALNVDRGIRLTERENAPKVVLIFNQALAEFRARTGGSHGGLIAGVAVVGATAVVLATRGGKTDTTTLSLANLHFTTPVVTCPDGFQSFPLVVELAGDVVLPGPYPVTLTGAQVTLVITSSPGLPSEVGFSSSLPTMLSPSTAPIQTVPVAFSTTLVCGNGAGDAPRVNEFLARVSLTTARGLVTAETADRMRVNIP